MSTKIASMYAEISAKDNLTPTLKSLVGQFIGLTSAAAIGGMAIRGFSDYIKDSVRLAAEAETGMARLNTTLIATGRGSEISAKQIDTIAVSLMKISTFDDEAIVSAYNTLAKFESIPTENLESIVKTSMDMSAAMGGDLTSNADSLGRALETGVIPRTWGFNAALKEQFAAEVKAGNSAHALTLMMDELNKRYGGQAAAQINTYNGQLAIFKNQWEENKEAIGATLLPMGMAMLGTKGLADRATDLGMNIQSLSWTFSSYAEKLEIVTVAENKLTDAKSKGNIVYQQSTEYLIALAQAQQGLGKATEGAIGYFDSAKGVFDDLNSTFGITDMRTQAVGLAFGYLTQQGIDTMIAMHNFDAALQAWGNKPITKNIIVNMWFNAMGDIAVQQGMSDRGAYLQQQANAQLGGGGSDWYRAGTQGSGANLPVWKNRVTGAISTTPHARGGQLGGDWSEVGEEGSEGVSPSGVVVPHPQWEYMKRHGLVPGRHFAKDPGGGAAVNSLTYLTNSLPIVGSNDPYAKWGGAGGYGPAGFQTGWQEGQGSTGGWVGPSSGNSGAVMQAVSAVTASTQSVSSAAVKISESGEKTMQATQIQTQQNNTGNMAMLAELKDIKNVLMKNLHEMPRQWASANARNQ